LFESLDCGLEVVAHQIEFVRAILLRRVDGQLGRRESENEPAFTRVHVRELQDVAEELAVRLGVTAIEDDVCPGYQVEFRPTTVSNKRSRPALAGRSTIRAFSSIAELGTGDGMSAGDRQGEEVHIKPITGT
jgi:hypothetical protein